MASLLFALFRPGEARAATVNAYNVELDFGSGSREFALRDIEAVRLDAGARRRSAGEEKMQKEQLHRPRWL